MVNLNCRRVFARFVKFCSLAAQDHFKQSTTRLYWIADKVIVRAPSCLRGSKQNRRRRVEIFRSFCLVGIRDSEHSNSSNSHTNPS